MSFNQKVKYQNAVSDSVSSLIITFPDDLKKEIESMDAFDREFFVFGNGGSDIMDLQVRDKSSGTICYVQDVARSVPDITDGIYRILRQKLWWPELQSVDTAKSVAGAPAPGPKLVVDIPETFKARFTFIYADGRVETHDTYPLPGELYMAYRDMLDAKCHLLWQVTKETIGKPCPMRLRVDEDERVLDTEMVPDTWTGLTSGAAQILRREKWTAK